jgi:FkbM family methyltransferase
MVKKNITTKILDIGARYGIHPTWKKFSGEKKIYLVEPDKDEARRIKKKYKNINDIKIYTEGIHPFKKKINLNIFENPAMSSTLARNNISPLFWGERKRQLKIKKKILIKCQTLDNFLNEKKIKVDFLKIDIEGLEPYILEGSSKIFKHLIAIRSEVSFANIFKTGNNVSGTFSQLHDLLVNRDFMLLNLDYQGRGDFFNNNISLNSRYGILQNTDAVWIKNFKFIEKYADNIFIIKLASFLMQNNGIDLAIFLLEKFSKKFHKFKDLKKTKVYHFLNVSLLKHFYELKWIPGQSLKSFYR